MRLISILIFTGLFCTSSIASGSSLKEMDFTLHRILDDGRYHFRWCDSDQDSSDPMDCHVIGKISGFTDDELINLSSVVRKRVEWLPYFRAAQALTGLGVAAVLFFSPARWMHLGLKPFKFGGSQIPIVPSVLGGIFLNASLSCFHEEFCALKYRGEFGEQLPGLIDPASESLSVRVEKNLFYFAIALDDLLTSIDRCGESVDLLELSCEPRVLKVWEKVVPMSGGIAIDNGE